MFTDKEIQLMNSLGLSYNFDNLTDDEWCNLEEVVGDHLTLKCLDDDYDPNEEGLMCEDILAKLP